MKNILLATFCLSLGVPALAESTTNLKQQIDQLKKDYEARAQALEERIRSAEDTSLSSNPGSSSPSKNNSFNPAISLILNGNYNSYSRPPDSYALPGFALGDESGLDKEGFSLGETEITLSSNTDQYWRGQATLSLADDNGETSTELEEAFIETLGLDHGLTFRAGRFFSGIGYLNGKHTHAWNFNDAPLVYRAMFGNQIKQDGLRLNWALPTEQYIELGVEVGNGQSFPVGGLHRGIGDWAAFAKTGGDINDSASWQLGLSHFQAGDVKERTSTTHQFSGDSKLNGLDAVLKWSPNGDNTQKGLVLQGEYYQRSEDGDVDINGLGASNLSSDQTGWYAESIYKFEPHWKAGLRYDRLNSDITGNNNSVLQPAGLLDEGHNPHRSSAMLEWSPSEFSRIRLQYNHDSSTAKSDDQWMLQYTQALGSHGAHQF